MEKEDYGLLIMDNSQEGECDCNPGIMAVSWTILEILVAGILVVVAVVMAIKGVIKGISTLKERKQAKLVERQRKEDETREQIRLEEKDKLGAIESS